MYYMMAEYTIYMYICLHVVYLIQTPRQEGGVGGGGREVKGCGGGRREGGKGVRWGEEGGR